MRQYVVHAVRESAKGGMCNTCNQCVAPFDVTGNSSLHVDNIFLKDGLV